MNREVIHIKNMVCPRCIMVVGDILKQIGIEPLTITLGEVTLPERLTDVQHTQLSKLLLDVGFELLDNKQIQLTEKIKNILIDLVREQDSDLKVNLSDYLTEKLPSYTYHYLSNLFSETEHTTIEKYFIAQKIERVKELLTYDELTLNEIASQLNYSSTAHLSSQFKKITGLTPSQFKKASHTNRTPLDGI